MDLKMEAYTPGLELLGLLEVQNSVIWENKAFGAGSFSVSSLLTDDTKSLLAAENIIWISGDDAGVIEYINQEAEESTSITVKGCNLTGLLSRRILWGRYDLTGTPPQIMHYLVNDCAVNPTRGDVQARKIPGLVLLDPPSGGASIRIQRTGGELLETLEELGATYGVAFGIRFNPAVPQMEFWTRWGVNRSIRQNVNDPVFYSTELDDVLSSEYTYNSQDYRNVALIAGEGEGNDRVMVTVEGEDETYVPDVPTPEPTPEKYTITLSVDPSGGGIATGGGTVDGGSTITVTAAPAQKYGFVGWRENGVIISTEPAYTFKVGRNRTLVAVFVSTVTMYTVTVIADPTGGGTVSGGGSVEQGESVTLTQTTATGYNFTGWYNGNTLLSTANPYTFTPTANITVTAKFAAIPVYTVTATIDPAGSGTVTGAGQYREGAQATITATPAEGYTFNGWTEGGTTVSTSESYTFTVTGNRTFVAAFAEASKEPVWVGTTLPSSAKWDSVAYGGGKFVSVVYDSNKYAYSTDGINWTAATLPLSGKWNEITYGDGKFVMVQTGSKSLCSTDGISWTAGTLSQQAGWTDVAYGSGKFVAVANYSTACAYSIDGINWTASKLPSSSSSAGTHSITYGDGKFVVVLATGVSLCSTDGISWTAGTLPSSSGWDDVTYGNGKFVAVTYKNSNEAAYSTDGISWTATTLPSNAYWDSVAYGGGKFVVIGDSSNKSAYSTDGINWASATLPLSGNWDSIAYGNGRFATVATSSNKAAYTL